MNATPSTTPETGRPLARDALIAITLAMLYTITFSTHDLPVSLYDTPAWWPYLAGVLLTLPLAWRRRAPIGALAAVTVGAAALHAVQPLNLVASVAAFSLAVYSVGVHADRFRETARLAAVASLALLVGSSYLTLGIPVAAWTPRVTLAVVMLGAGWVLGDQVRVRRIRERELARLADELRAEREINIQRAAAEERLRVARELHDVLGHHISLMGVQATGAQTAMGKDAARVRRSLSAIEASSRQAVSEMQRILDLLRAGDSEQPGVGLAEIDEVLDAARAAGLTVRAEIGEAYGLPAPVDLAAIRVVQESVTNTLRHAGPDASMSVRIERCGSELHVVVEDDGGDSAAWHPRPPEGAGRGIAGLRERVGQLGGSLHAGPLQDGGFRIDAKLPLSGANDEPAEIG